MNTYNLPINYTKMREVVEYYSTMSNEELLDELQNSPTKLVNKDMVQHHITTLQLYQTIAKAELLTRLSK